ncbi:hypothetical protein ZYGR_0A01020 [Zygosaccharomyces rouxii]|uniref:tRNA wybutosine-synthesizing protein 2 n=2 Tax=Zygosaccharomyces rouxii TaxID=4956 RepID=C5DPC7_ZYGRC|nr:uncharacterized protein ZYRO0A02266g [Zygosaccharomyces rouxii]KAH9198942.1 S-adenosyl-L-methionine-dependent methyltransferase [Zygosaccharomyces rouxii]GAV46510.1 hypothetical protein ZYGR_0A01020 [Zygosaccharomyces rouxii]CAR25538.1 ZYRO0A02266p [Zygosaccharomyces rouxii]
MAWEIVVNDSKLIKAIKNELESKSLFVKPIYREGSKSVIRTGIDDADDEVLGRYGSCKRWYELDRGDTDGGNQIVRYTRKYLIDHNCLSQELMEFVPLRYTIYTPLLLFNNSEKSFNNDNWNRFFAAHDPQDFFAGLAQCFPQVTHIAINMPIVESDTMRRPFQLHPLYGEFNGKLSANYWLHPTQQDFENTLWCHTVQNGIHQYWAPMFTMFSRGNIKEKKRILDTFEGIEGNDVVDLYAGIGYFTLSYLKRGARNCFCFELNPWSTQALKRGVTANGFNSEKVHVYTENNINALERIKNFEPKDLRIRHINLGLLPSSKDGWSIAQSIIHYQDSLSDENHKVTLHIHENVHVDRLQDGTFIQSTIDHLSMDRNHNYSATHLERIKTFAPDVWHVCLDVDVHGKSKN